MNLGPYKKQIVDRTGWPAGPWDHEPDEIYFHEHGLPCCILRMPWGSLCGYVGLPPGHPAYGFSYDTYSVELDELEKIQDTKEFCRIARLVNDIFVHGGLTFARQGKENDFWWFGFDCAHSGDIYKLSRLDDPMWKPQADEKYRDKSYVTLECEKLAKQLSEIK